MYENPWTFNDIPFDSDQINDYFGFVYCITCILDGKKYIGRKYFYSSRKPTRKATRRKKVESDWKDYYGSNDEIKALIREHGKNIFRREIISLHTTRGRVNYEEVREQFLNGVLEDDKYYNENINGKWFRPKDHIRAGSKYSTASGAFRRTSQ